MINLFLGSITPKVRESLQWTSGFQLPVLFFYHGFADLLRHIRILSILRAHFGLIRCIHRQINARGRLAYRLVITGIYA